MHQAGLNSQANPYRKPQARFYGRCPSCSAPNGMPCRNAEGKELAVPHFQRNTQRRHAIATAMYLYKPLEKSGMNPQKRALC